MNTNTGIVMIRGREYQTVALRVQKFREAHPDWSLTSEIIQRDEITVVVKASIADPTGRVLATGHAEEVRTSSQINQTSALENGETSAFGRALAALGFGGNEFASADEVANAIHQQQEKKAKPSVDENGDYFVEGLVADYHPPREGKSGKLGPSAFVINGKRVQTFDFARAARLRTAFDKQLPAKVWYESQAGTYGTRLNVVSVVVPDLVEKNPNGEDV